MPGGGDAGLQGGVPRGAEAGAQGQLPEELQEDRAEGALRQRRHPAAEGGVHHVGAPGMQVRNNTEYTYRVTIQLVANLPLTSKLKFCFGS